MSSHGRGKEPAFPSSHPQVDKGSAWVGPGPWEPNMRRSSHTSVACWAHPVTPPGEKHGTPLLWLGLCSASQPSSPLLTPRGRSWLCAGYWDVCVTLAQSPASDHPRGGRHIASATWDKVPCKSHEADPAEVSMGEGSPSQPKWSRRNNREGQQN